jgi:hypothetical protein
VLKVCVFLVLIALMLGVLEVGQNVQFLRTGEIPAAVVAAGNTSYFVSVMDLGLVVPLCLLAASCTSSASSSRCSPKLGA